MSTYLEARAEARALLGEPKALHGSSFISIFRRKGTTPESDFHFAVRGSRTEALKAEGFLLVAQMDLSGNVTEIPPTSKE